MPAWGATLWWIKLIAAFYGVLDAVMIICIYQRDNYISGPTETFYLKYIPNEMNEIGEADSRNNTEERETNNPNMFQPKRNQEQKNRAKYMHF